jgi:dephospho-CoA kinase
MLRDKLPSFKGILGLCGGVGSGKSTCRAWLASQGALCVDCDKLGHASYAPGGPAYAAVVALFPSAVDAPGGVVDRRRLGELVFSDPAARSALNAAVWPALFGLVAEELAALAAPRVAAGEGGLLGVVEAAILLEAGWAPAMDGVWLLDVPQEAAVERLVASRGLTQEAALARVAAQPTAAERLASPSGAAITQVISTGAPLADTQALYSAAWAEFTSKLA